MCCESVLASPETDNRALLRLGRHEMVRSKEKSIESLTQWFVYVHQIAITGLLRLKPQSLRAA